MVSKLGDRQDNAAINEANELRRGNPGFYVSQVKTWLRLRGYNEVHEVSQTVSELTNGLHRINRIGFCGACANSQVFGCGCQRSLMLPVLLWRATESILPDGLSTSPTSSVKATASFVPIWTPPHGLLAALASWRCR